ncbi:MAG: prephenate dehydratase [Deltaproteobacteria bacterium]|nr:prephenate dehydratase [Deltaproteobacteria bacterium]
MQLEKNEDAGRDELDLCRKEIDAIDTQLLSLLAERLDAAAAIGRIKNNMGLPVFDPVREKAILDRMAAKGHSRLTPDAIRDIFTRIISVGRAVQGPVNVGFLGPEATFSHQAAISIFGNSARFFPSRTFEGVFGSVEKGHCHHGVIPVENSLEGSVAGVWDLFDKFYLKICGEYYHRIRLSLMGRSLELNAIRKLYSHPMPLAQCRSWLKSHLPNVTLEPVESTALAGKMAAGDPNSAALGSCLLAETLGLKLLREDIEDEPHNVTRFLVVGNGEPQPTGKDKTTLMFFLGHRPGALAGMLSTLAQREINVCRIESRPMPMRSWEYLFFVDLEGHRNDPALADAMVEMKTLCVFMKWLGSYPSAGVS